jgi:sulfide dehydrogenase cytochrome subunit
MTMNWRVDPLKLTTPVRVGATMRTLSGVAVIVMVWFTTFTCELATASSMTGPVPSSTLSNNCAACHGTFGYSSKPMPIIAGLSGSYLGRVLKQFKTDKRPSTIMGRIAKGYTDREIDDIAAFFSSQRWKSPTQEVTPVKVEKGRNLHKEKCEPCHHDNGRYQDDKIPRIAGQWREYLEIILQEYKRYDRKMPNFFMTIIARQLSPEDISALANFYASTR